MLRCMDKKEAESIKVDLHEGSFDTHSSGHRMDKKDPTGRILLFHYGSILLSAFTNSSQRPELC